MFNSKNLNYVFNCEYYELENHINEKNEAIKNFEFTTPMCGIEELTDNCNCFQLKVIYPGLLIGIGNPHGKMSARDKEAIELGFTFDYVTGLPYIPGSSVKGTLRNAFKEPEYIKELLDLNETSDFDVKALEESIFGEIQGERYITSPKKRDIFFDAVIKSDQIPNNRIMGLDNITPHRQDLELLELAEPNPLTLVKVRPGIVFQFRFLLIESGGINIEQKLRLFKSILKDLGIGAKTNVGYGQFVE
ncbi:MAG: type III-B CRISPR module RAMP protein Cmr6 [Eubacteriaceae bacterium]